jgi:hypothetical protein
VCVYRGSGNLLFVEWIQLDLTPIEHAIDVIQRSGQRGEWHRAESLEENLDIIPAYIQEGGEAI